MQINPTAAENQYILGLDIGTGSLKGIAMSLAGNITGVSQQHYPLHQSEPGYSEQEPEAIWQAFILCVQQIVKINNAPPVAISLSSAMHSLILVDANCHALSPMITWADVRSEQIAQQLRDSEQGESIYRATGTPIHPMSPLCKLIWIRENQPQKFEQTYKFISIKEYIWYKLFKCFQVDYSIASATGLFDIVKLGWNDEACNLAGIDHARLSEAVDTDYTRSDVNKGVAAMLHIGDKTSFVIGASDGCCANIGSYAVAPGTAALTIGTSGAVRITSKAPIYNFAGMTFNYLLNRNTFVNGGAVNNGGIAVDWLLRSFLNKSALSEADYNYLFKAIDSVPALSDGLLFLPYLYGERAPIWDAMSSAAYVNIQPIHTQAHFLRAGLEGICYALFDVMRSLEDASVPIQQISISGGFINSGTWVKILADITGKRLVIQQTEDASAMGAIYLAVNTLYPELTLPSKTDNVTIHPDKENHARYAEAFPLFKKIYQDLKDSMHLLHQLSKK